MKSEAFYGMKYMQFATQVLAVLFNVALLIASGMEIYHVFTGLWDLNIESAIQNGLFVLILLEMFYVVRSFIKYGSVNVSLIISVGIVAIVKEVIFNLKSMELNTALAFSALFITFCIGIMIEDRSYQTKILRGEKPRGIGSPFASLAPEEHVKSELTEKPLVNEV